MANTKISELPSTTTITDEDAMPVVQEGVTKKFTGVLTALKTLLGIGDPETLQTQSKEVVGAVNELNGKTESSFTLDPSSGLIIRGTQTVRKTSHEISVSMAFSLSKSINEPIVIAVLPEGFRPERNITKFVSLGGKSALLSIYSNGEVRLGYTAGEISEDAYIYIDETLMI